MSEVLKNIKTDNYNTMLGTVIKKHQTKYDTGYIIRIPCECSCHINDGTATMHFMPCCDNGWIEKYVINRDLQILDAILSLTKK